MDFPYQTEETPLKIYRNELPMLRARLDAKAAAGQIAIKKWSDVWDCWGLTQEGKDWIVELSFTLEP